MGSDWLEETQTEKPLGEWTRDIIEEKVYLGTRHNNVKTAENCGTILDELQQRGFTHAVKPWSGKSEQTRAKTATENEKDNISYPLSLYLSISLSLFLSLTLSLSLSFSLHTMFYFSLFNLSGELILILSFCLTTTEWCRSE